MSMAGVEGMGDYCLLDQSIAKPIHMLLIADPRTLNEFVLERTGKTGIFQEFPQNMYMRKNWQNIQKALLPDAVMILGDLINEGRKWDNVKWELAIHRFNIIFMQTPSLKQAPVFYLAGNQDIGFGNNNVSYEAYNRFRTVFGKTNYSLKIGNHSIIALDTVTLSGKNENLSLEATHLIEGLKMDSNKAPRILFTHTPLYRPPNTDCGPPRQNNRHILDESISTLILENVRPKLVFSGDAYNDCEIRHKSVDAVEITVNSFNFAMVS
ncbi:5303_t:CDS:2 [Ambispora gerdemannii]|uniref:5303_t:CDS:1 n=1 Tax=Ambispora gerdemannii TaxID=144530 RepID=A0A9N8UYU5_9GLOM|nr:5303_t:CDS:2 [Ambispora gerdemannii]